MEVSNDAEIRESILACGVSVAALSKTLPLLGQPDLRTHVMSKDWRRKHDARGLVLSPATGKDRNAADMVFQVLGKEFVLVGADIQLVPLTKLMRTILGERENYDEKLGYRLAEAEVVLIGGFFRLGFPKNPYADQQVFDFYEYLVDGWGDGKVFYFQSEAPFARCSAWWDKDILETIASHTDAYEVRTAP
jgi:hypothetical protein